MRKLPKLSKGKARRWRKGQSSSSNPETHKFREAAKSRFFQHDLGASSALTVGALKTLDAFNNKKAVVKEAVKFEPLDTDSNGTSWTSGTSFQTFASDWSECSNASYSKLLHNFQPTSYLHKEMLAVLAAVAEVIKSNGGSETSTEYFGALMTALETSDSEDSVAAIISLIAMGIKSVPQEVLRLKFSEVSKVFIDLLAKFSQLENHTILKAIFVCLSVLLRSQDPSIWSNSSTAQIFQSILVFATHTKPKIRKAAQHSICAILKASAFLSEEDTHPGASLAAKYCIQQIEKGVSFSGNTTTLHILSLLKEIIGTFPKSSIKSTCETILKLMTLGNALVTNCSFEVLHGLFVSSPPTTRLQPTLNAQLINALYDYQPSNNDAQPTLAWLTVMQEAHRALVKSSPELCSENLVKFFVVASKLWLSDSNDILKGCTVSLRTVALDCIKPCSECRNYAQMCVNIFAIVESGLKYQYHDAWIHVLNLLGVLFEVIGSDGRVYMKQCLKSLADLHDSYNFSYTGELEFTIGKAIRSLGPEIVLEGIPFTLTGQETNYEFKRTWLLPVLKDNVQQSTVEFFARYFIPLATICERKSKELNSKNDRIGSHSFNLLQSQIWALLPPFCGNANDIKDNFKGIAKTLGVLISDRKDLRLHAMSALRKMVIRQKEHDNAENISELSKYAKNYLPILFNLYTTKPNGTDEEGQRLAALETIKVYLTISSSELNGELHDRAVKRLSEAEGDLFLKESVLDLIKALLPYQDQERISNIYELCMKMLQETKCRKEEKKSFRMLEEIISSESKNCKKFVLTKRKEIQAILLKSLRKTKVFNKGARLRCLLHLVKLLPKNHFNIVKTILPETIICCRDVNGNARACAFLLLEEMFNACRRWSDKPVDEIIRDYIGLMLGGLAGSATLISATILGLTKLVYTLKDEIPIDTLQLLIENMCILVTSQTREVVGPSLGFHKLLVSSFSKDIVLPFVPNIVKSLVSMTEDCKRHFRLKTRDIFDRLIRKFGYDMIKPLIPGSDTTMQKRLKNLKRINAKKKQAKTEGKGKQQDYDDDFDEFATRAKPKSIEEILASSDESDKEEEEPRKKLKAKRKETRKETFIKEDADNIMDFISPTASSRITATKPVQKTKKEAFATSSDGRLIIADDDNDDGSGMDADSDDSDVDDVTASLKNVVVGRKRKMSVSSEPPNKYQAGGSGIHRPIQNKKDSKEGRVKKLSKKQKGRPRDEIKDLKTGKEYQGKKAKGDMKLKGKPDPFAYIPLSRKMLNKRKKLKNSGKFRNVIKSAMKGAKQGTKAKARRKR